VDAKVEAAIPIKYVRLLAQCRIRLPRGVRVAPLGRVEVAQIGK